MKNIKTKEIHDNSLIFLEFPDFSYLKEPQNVNFFSYEHIHYFCLSSFIQLVKKAGFEIVCIKRTLNKKNLTCTDYCLQVLLRLNKLKEKNLLSLWGNKFTKQKKIFRKFFKKKKNFSLGYNQQNFLYG